MNFSKRIRLSYQAMARGLMFVASLFLVSCAYTGSQPQAASPASTNPYPAGTYENFKAENYPQKSTVFRNEPVLALTTPENSRIVISLSLQRAFLMNGDQVALDYPVSTGKSTHPTPAGTYNIKEMIVDKRSNLYGRVLDASGNVVNSDADSRKATIPPGGQFLGAPMPYWMRFTWTGIGHHVGNVPRYPASHACIRGQAEIMPLVFSKVKLGTVAQVVP